MARARVCTVVDAPAPEMFRALLDWGAWDKWTERLAGFSLESGAPGVVGSVRAGASSVGPVARERMTVCDEANYTLTYVVEEPAPFPARGYVASVRLVPLTEQTGTTVEWVGTFYSDDPRVEEGLRVAMEGYYRDFIDGLAKFAASSSA